MTLTKKKKSFQKNARKYAIEMVLRKKKQENAIDHAGENIKKKTARM